ncbi:MAG: hypothetical protein KAF42_08940, partial [Sphingopyxis terrae]|nr:hypothetical protein [Sphingopyxis terrae]
MNYMKDIPPAATDTGATIPPLLHYWRIFIQRRWIILAIVCSTLIAAIIYTLLSTKLYTATTRIEVAREEAKVTNVQSVQADVSNDDLEFYQTQYSLLEARSLAERVARELKLARNKEFIKNENIRLSGIDFFSDVDPAELTRKQQEELEAKIVKALRNRLSISPIRQSSLIDISYTSNDRELAALIANTWAKQFIASNLDRRFASTADARQFLQKRIDELRELLERSERSLVGYSADKEIIALTSEEGNDGRTRTLKTLASANLEALNNALAEATAARVEAESAAKQSGINTATLTNLALNGMREKRAQVASDYARILVQFEPDYPGAKALKSQIDALDRSIAAEERRILSSSNTTYRQALQRENDLRVRVNALKAKLIDQQRAGIQLNIIQRDVDTYRQLYDGLLQRYKEIGVAGVGQNNISVIDRAKVPDKPSRPSMPINLALGLLAGLLLSGGVIFALEQIDDSIQDPSDVSRRLGLPLLGTVPAQDEGSLRDDIRDPKTDISEAILSLQTNLSFLTDHGVPRSFMLT